MGCGASVEGGGGAAAAGKLDYQGLTQLPRDAFRRSGICELVLRECKLELFELSGLITLDVAENELSAIPPLIANLSALQVRDARVRPRAICARAVGPAA